MSTLEVVAPDGLGEVTEGMDLIAAIADLLAGVGGLVEGDLVVITSKIISKHEGRLVQGTDRAAAVAGESVRTVAHRGGTRIVQSRLGLVHAAAGVDASNTAPGTLLLLPVDPDASARRIRTGLADRSGVVRLGVVITDTSGRAWRQGQTDLAIGVAGVRPILDHTGTTDPYGNDLRVTAMAVADEIAAAADLVKGKTSGRPIARVRGLSELVTDDPVQTVDLLRTGPGDMFARGSREAVLHAVLAALDASERYEDLVDQPDPTAAVLEITPEPWQDLVRRLLA